MNITILACSLHPQSRSYVLAKQTAEEMKALGTEPKLIDLRHLDLPFCGPSGTGDFADTKMIRATVEESDAVIIAAPVYNYDLNAATKNLIELTGRAWTGNLVGFLCAAGGQRSYMSVMNMANNLMLDFRCIIVPRFVYATGADFGDDRQPTMFIESEIIKERVQELAAETIRLTKALS